MTGLEHQCWKHGDQTYFDFDSDVFASAWSCPEHYRARAYPRRTLSQPQIARAALVIIEYSAALCGEGKTWWACRSMAETPGRYLYAVDRRDVFADRADLIRSFAAETGTAPKIGELYSHTAKRRAAGFLMCAGLFGRPDVSMRPSRT